MTAGHFVYAKTDAVIGIRDKCDTLDELCTIVRCISMPGLSQPYVLRLLQLRLSFPTMWLYRGARSATCVALEVGICGIRLNDLAHCHKQMTAVNFDDRA